MSRSLSTANPSQVWLLGMVPTALLVGERNIQREAGKPHCNVALYKIALWSGNSWAVLLKCVLIEFIYFWDYGKYGYFSWKLNKYIPQHEIPHKWSKHRL